MLPFRRSAFRLLAAAAAVVTAGSAARALEVTFGGQSDPHVTIIFGKDKAGPRAITVFTQMVGGPGSTVEVTVDKGMVPLFKHDLTADDCTAGDKGMRCKFVLPGGTPDYDHLVDSFKRGKMARIRVTGPGGPEMKQKAPLKGFTKGYDALGAS